MVKLDPFHLNRLMRRGLGSFVYRATWLATHAAAAALAVQLRHLPAEVQRASADSCGRKRGRQEVGGRMRSRSE